MSFCTLTLTFSCLLGGRPCPTKQNILVYRSLPVSSKQIELFTALNSFPGAVKTYKLTRVYFLLELVEVVN